MPPPPNLTVATGLMRGHDLRRTFITLAQVDGARRDLLETVKDELVYADEVHAEIAERLR